VPFAKEKRGKGIIRGIRGEFLPYSPLKKEKRW